MGQSRKHDLAAVDEMYDRVIPSTVSSSSTSTVSPLFEPTSRRPDPSDPNIRKAPVKVFVQVPCLNEEATLPSVLDSIPKSIPGVDELHVLVIDDGSTDRTVEVARMHGVTHFVHHV